jgi:hypothetical protein
MEHSQCLLLNKMYQNDKMCKLKFVTVVSDPPQHIMRKHYNLYSLCIYEDKNFIS